MNELSKKQETWKWKKGKVKNAFVRKNEKANEEDPVVLSLARSGVKIRDITTGEGQLAENYSKYNPVEPGDLLLNPMDLYSGANCSLSKVSGVISPAYINLRAKKNILPKFYDYYFKVQYWSMAFFANGKGVSFDNRWTLNVETLMNYPIPLPPLSEQQKIADYLDEKVKEIDNAIEKTKETIELYKSFANSMSTEFVTGKNLKSPKVKYDNMNYLGEVPKSWKITKLKTIFRFVSVKNHPNSEVLSLYRDYGVIPKSSRDDNHNVTSLNLDSYKFVKKGNLVINKMKAWQGSLAISNYEGIVSPAYHVFEFKTNDINKMYIHYLIRSKQYAKEFERLSTGMRIGQWDLSKEDFLNTSIIIPDIKTQEEIVEKIEKNMNNIFILINKKNKLIDDLENYKKSLIYEYVTGKKEVK